MRLLRTFLVATVLLAGALPAQATLSGSPSPQRLVLDVTSWTDRTTTLRAQAPMPDQADGIGPGSNLLITRPDGTYICSANFVWASGSTRYLGAAGHCFLPAAATSTHGLGADFNAKGVTTRVCVLACTFGGELSGLTGTYVTLGAVKYARQTGSGGDLGNDFGVVEIPANLAAKMRPSMPVWGGPSAVATLKSGETVCHYGNAVGFGEVYPTKARVGVGRGTNPTYWIAATASAPGDSGAALITCVASGSDVRGSKAIGILTHIAPAQGIVGTTMQRAADMAREAGLNITPVLAS